jgi:hypothetical protein
MLTAHGTPEHAFTATATAPHFASAYKLDELKDGCATSSAALREKEKLGAG